MLLDFMYHSFFYNSYLNGRVLFYFLFYCDSEFYTVDMNETAKKFLVIGLVNVPGVSCSLAKST